MATANLRELVLYRKDTGGQFRKARQAAPTFNETRALHSGGLRVFAPDDNFALCWSVVMIVAVLHQAISVPFFLAFEPDETSFTLVLDFICTVTFLGDILVTANTSFYRKGMLIQSRKVICVRYLHTWLLPDILASFPYTWLLSNPFEPASTEVRTPSLLRLIRIARLLRGLRLMKITKMRQHLAAIEQKLSSSLSILFAAVSLCLLMTCLAHWVACAFYAVSLLEVEVDGWVGELNLISSGQSDKYVSALYWAVTTLTTTGYGDIVPISRWERLLGIVVMGLSAGVFSYLIGKIGGVISLMEMESSRQKDVEMDVTRYLRRAEVSAHVSYRALRYVEYVWESRKRRKVLDSRLLQGFSEPLKNEISEHIFGLALQRVPLLCKFDRSFISQLARGVQPELFAQDDLIFEGNQPGTVLYFLEKGCVELFHKASAHTFYLLQPGQHFGELAFLSGGLRTASARCLQFSEALAVKRETLQALLDIIPSAKYTFQVLCDHLEAKDFSALGLACYLCGDGSHLAHKCPRFQLTIDKKALTNRWLRKRWTSQLASRPELPNFQRRQRSVSTVKHYSIQNVRSTGWNVLKGCGYGLRTALHQNQPVYEPNSAGGNRRRSSGLQRTSTTALQTDFAEWQLD